MKTEEMHTSDFDFTHPKPPRFIEKVLILPEDPYEVPPFYSSEIEQMFL
jgi:hypothetical protein